MHINEYGSGKKTLILVHGGPSLFGYMKSLGDQLSHKYKIVDYAQRGTFETPRTDNDQLSFDSHIEDLRQIIETYNKEQPVTLIGHSWGADLALLTVAKHQGLVEKVISLGTASLEEETGDIFANNIQARLSAEIKIKLEDIDERYKTSKTIDEMNLIMQERLALTGPVYHLDPLTEEMLPESKWNFNSFSFSIDSIWELIESGEVPTLLKEIKEPVIAIHGDYDPIPLKETFKFLEENIPRIKTIEVPKSGHFPWLEKTSKDFFIEVLLEELK
ncbi:alpha/beta hydrolase [Halobacteriovorax marinus]|uniref:Alpha/beta hydrolase n=1 Tax=Halobacteriovorax marinus TaxID=97084 RepID=A0A1Y5F295_9BACT|nr:alpha/beta hydrolase [Halobacteriovorax marinus]